MGAAVAPAALPGRAAVAGARDELAAEVAALPADRCATRSSASSPAGPATRRRSRRATSRRSTCAAARACTSPTTPTATRASAAWRCCGSRSSTAPPGCRWTSRRAARPPGGHARVRGARPGRATARRCWPSTARRSSCCGCRCTTSRARTPTCSTRSPRCCRALSVTERAEVARLAREGPPEEAVGLEPYGPPEAMPTGARA